MAHWPNLAHHLFFVYLQGKDGFYICNGWKQLQRRIFYGTRILHEIQISMSISKVLLEYAALICLQIVYGCFGAIVAKVRKETGSDSHKA